MPYQDFSKFGSGSDWEIEIVFSCGSLIPFEMPIGTLEACLFTYSFKDKCYVTSVELMRAQQAVSFFKLFLGSYFEYYVVFIGALSLSEGRQCSEGRGFKLSCQGRSVQIPLWLLWE